MNSDLPPSGAWTGYYFYSGGQKRHRMDLALEFAAERITGEGSDDVGGFIVSGRYDAKTGECHWTKTYVAAHDVYYQGTRVGKRIGGTWELGRHERGGFRVWPLAHGSSEDDVATEEIEQPVDAVGVVVAASASGAFDDGAL